MRPRPDGDFAIKSTRPGAGVPGAAAGLVLALVLGACAGPGGKPAKAVAAVTVENHSDYAWRVEFFDRVDAVAVASADLGPREGRRLKLAPGTYRVRSVVAGPDAAERVATAPGAETEVVLRAGRTYAWPLGTLLSAETPGP